VKKLLIKGAEIVDPANDIQKKLDLLIVNGVIASIAPDITIDQAVVIDASGLICAPGLVDIHVHLRDPGQTHKEDIESGCCAAAAGGVTSLACMPNTLPVCDNAKIISDIKSRSKNARANVYPVAAITKSLEGKELTDFAELKSAGAVAVSDDGRPVPLADIMLQAVKNAAAHELKVLSHCEELTLVKDGLINEGKISKELGVPGITTAAEDIGTARDIAIAASTGMPVHICHISSRGSVEMLREAKRRGIPVTGETAPHYFVLTEERLKTKDADFRMNPPLRTEDDVKAVIEGLCDGTISAIATDHAPHTDDEKKDFFKAPNGVIGLETSLSAGITYLVKTGCITISKLISLMSTQPAEILGIPAGSLSEGSPADIVLFDPNEKWIVKPEELHGKSRNTPFKGMILDGRVKTTLLGGRIVYRNGQII
jgi:dihydroorotase